MPQITDHNQRTRHTKIIATLGPASDSQEVLYRLLVAGVDMVRLNFSHGDHAEHGRRIAKIRECCEAQNCVVGVLADLQGPKIRVTRFKNKKIILAPDQPFALDASLDEKAGNEQEVGIDYKDLPNDVKAGDILLLDDGRIVLTVNAVKGPRIECTVKVGGPLSDHKGINRQGGGLSAKALTEKDIEDMQFAIDQEVDFIAISFPRNANDIHEARRLVKQFGGTCGIIAKIERTEAITNLIEIINASDGVMVARGDLGVEIGDAHVPMVQKEIIQKARSLNKPVITATQMMESMIQNSVPTRAEVSDVANAVLDYTDAVMLSAETATGLYPVEVVEAMSRICMVAEKNPITQISKHRVEQKFQRVDEAIAMATMYTANHFNIKAILALTESGQTPLWMSRIRSGIPIYGLARDVHTLGRMTLYRGVFPIAFNATAYTRDEINRKAINTLAKYGILAQGEYVIMTKGDHIGTGGGANAMKILQVGQVV